MKSSFFSVITMLFFLNACSSLKSGTDAERQPSSIWEHSCTGNNGDVSLYQQSGMDYWELYANNNTTETEVVFESQGKVLENWESVTAHSAQLGEETFRESRDGVSATVYESFSDGGTQRKRGALLSKIDNLFCQYKVIRSE